MSGSFLSPLPGEEADDADDEENTEDADEGRGEPVVLFTLIEHDLQAAHSQGEKTEADVIHVAQLGRVGLDPRRIFDEARDQNEGENADGNIDEEDPAPGEVVGDPAAERGADGRREHGDEAVEREGLAALVRLERVGHDGLRHGLHAAAAGALKNAAKQKDGQGRSDAAKKTGDGEDGDAKDEEVAAAHERRGPAAERQHDGIGDEVAGEHPCGFVSACAERAADVRQGDVGDGGVKHFHKRGQGHGHGDQPRIYPRLPGGMQREIRILNRRRPCRGPRSVARQRQDQRAVRAMWSRSRTTVFSGVGWSFICVRAGEMRRTNESASI